MARILLPSDTAARPSAIQAATNRSGQPGTVELAAVWLFCLGMTLGPVLLFLAAANG